MPQLLKLLRMGQIFLMRTGCESGSQPHPGREQQNEHWVTYSSPFPLPQLGFYVSTGPREAHRLDSGRHSKFSIWVLLWICWDCPRCWIWHTLVLSRLLLALLLLFDHPCPCIVWNIVFRNVWKAIIANWVVCSCCAVALLSVSV